ncbi:MAG: hypothetical protein ACLTAD_10550 [Coprococcus phoceensis]
MAKKEPAQYIVEREFLGKFSVEELLVRIVKSHVKKRTIKRVKPLKTMERSRTLWYNIIIGTAVE